jgi:hypothetical protein
MMAEHIVVCLYWGMQSIPSAKIRCSTCPADLAADPANLRLGMRAICFECMLKMQNPIFGGVTSFGLRMPAQQVGPMPQSLLDYMRRQVELRKRSLAIASN